jgi:hypothetical protein
MVERFSKVVSPEARKVDLQGKKVHANVNEASRSVKERLLSKYFGDK